MTAIHADLQIQKRVNCELEHTTLYCLCTYLLAPIGQSIDLVTGVKYALADKWRATNLMMNDDDSQKNQECNIIMGA